MPHPGGERTTLRIVALYSNRSYDNRRAEHLTGADIVESDLAYT